MALCLLVVLALICELNVESVHVEPWTILPSYRCGRQPSYLFQAQPETAYNFCQVNPMSISTHLRRVLGPPLLRPPPSIKRPLVRLSTMSTQAKMEEESQPGYDTADYFPVDIGQVFNSSYQVLGKLGFGNNSTVWLSRDLQQVYCSKW